MKWSVSLYLCTVFGFLGCTARHEVKNYQPGVKTRVFIDLRACRDLEKGQFVCNHVRFDPQELNAKR